MLEGIKGKRRDAFHPYDENTIVSTECHIYTFSQVLEPLLDWDPSGSDAENNGRYNSISLGTTIYRF